MDAGSPAESPKDVEPEPSLSEPAVSPSSAAACPAGPAGPVPLGAALAAAPATVTMAYPKAPAFTPVRTASHGPVRMSRSMVIPAEQFAAPKAWVFHGSGGSLPCAQSNSAANLWIFWESCGILWALDVCRCFLFQFLLIKKPSLLGLAYCHARKAKHQVTWPDIIDT